nr:hypothetical protein [Phomopsis viticola mycovirus 961]
MLFNVNIMPWTTSFSRVAMKNFAKVLPVYYAVTPGAKYGHISHSYFAGSKFGLHTKFLRRTLWADSQSYGIKDSFLSNPVGALGGVKFTLTQLPTEARSANIDKHWLPNAFSGNMLDQPLRYLFMNARTCISSRRTSEYERHYPRRHSLVDLPETFSANLDSIRWFKFRPQTNSHTIQTAYVGKNWIAPRSSRTVSAEFSDLDGLINGATDKQTLSTSQDRVAGTRFLGSRGDRIIQGWQAENIPRGLRFSAFTRQALKNVDYRSLAFRLWSRFLIESEFQELVSFNGTLPAEDQLPDLTLTTRGPSRANAQLTFIHAGIPAGAVPVNPEAPMWTDDAQAGLRAGTKQFIDAQDLSVGEIIELVSCLDRTIDDNQLLAKYGNQRDGEAYSHPLSRFLHNDCPVDEIFIHTGAASTLTPAQQQQIINHAHQRPDIGSITTVLRVLAVRHGIASQLDFGLELAMNRNSVFLAESAPSARPNTPRHLFLCSDGNYQLFLPRNYTASAYIDAFMQPMYPSQMLDQTLDSKPNEIIHSAALLGFFRMVSLNWAAFAMSLRGRHWQHRPTNEPIQRIRTFINIVLRTFNFDKITDWSTVHANAMAHQYGICPSPSVRSTEAGYVEHVTAEWTAPYFVNHYLELWAMDFMPTFQILPYFDKDGGSARVSWPQNLPNPIPPYEAFMNRVRLARDTPVFSKELWKSDGGYTRNAQFFTAAGRDDMYRFQGHPNDVSLMRWQGERVDSFPVAPAAQAIVWMENLNSPFSDFILPGSITNYNFQTNREYTYGIQANGQVDRVTRDRWFNAAKQEPFTSLMINYIHPTKDRRQLDNQLEYSTLLLESGNTYSGMVVVPHTLPDYEVDANFDPRAPDLHSSLTAPLPTSDPQPLTEVSPTRVAKRGAPGSRVAKLSTAKKPRFEDGSELKISYSPNNPETLRDLPTLDRHHVHTSASGIDLRDGPPPSDPQIYNKDWEDLVMAESKSTYNYDLEQQRSKELDDAYQEFLSQQHAKQAAFKRAQFERDQRISAAVNEARARHNLKKESRVRAAPTTNPVAARPQATSTIKPAYGRFPVKPVDPVIPNDADAGFTQARAVDISNDPAIISAGFRPQRITPERPRSQPTSSVTKPSSLDDPFGRGPELPKARTPPPIQASSQPGRSDTLLFDDDDVLNPPGTEAVGYDAAKNRSLKFESKAVENDPNYVTQSEN